VALVGGEGRGIVLSYPNRDRVDKNLGPVDVGQKDEGPEPEPGRGKGNWRQIARLHVIRWPFYQARRRL
jgi:hypothetical protein